MIIFNKSLEKGNFPKLLKISKIIPIYKGGDNDNPVNYTPISLQSIFDKIFEKIVYNRLKSFITKTKFDMNSNMVLGTSQPTTY